MKMCDAMKIIRSKKIGFMVHFEWIKGVYLKGDHFPDKHAGENLIATEDEAWDLAIKFAKKTKGKTANLYVTDSDFSPVVGYKEREIKNR